MTTEVEYMQGNGYGRKGKRPETVSEMWNNRDIRNGETGSQREN